MLIDKACGVTKPLKGGSDQRFVQFRCPKCKRVAKVKRDETDPPNCAVVEISCPDCNPGDRELIDYFDADGQQIDCDGKKLNDKDHATDGAREENQPTKSK